MASTKTPKQQRHVVATADEIGPGQRKIVTIGRREIGIFNIDGAYFALRNVCPHKGAPLCKGLQRPLITSSGVSQVAYQRENEIIKCPWHLWEFDIKTGRALHDAAVGVPSYMVQVEGSDVILYA
ncbi:MAG: Rieske (2Fe-2S) protein [Caldilineaceae bacterium]|nr:Rieske (2Fe-2S) protein [Caldilineaceae bacterium]